MRPIGIWSRVNATLKAVTEPVTIVEASEVSDDERDLGRPETERPRRHQAERLAAPRDRPASIWRS